MTDGTDDGARGGARGDARTRLEEQARAEGLSLMQEESVHTLHDSLSLAEAHHQASHPVRVAVGVVLFLIAALVPYALGRWIAVSRTDDLVRVYTHFDPRGLALIAWMDVTLVWISLTLAVISRRHRRSGLWWTLVLFVVEQFLAGVALLKWNFWNSTFVVFHARAIYANAINFGIIASVVAALAFGLLYLVLLLFVRPGSRADFLTSAPAALCEYLVLELVAILVVLFGGLLTMIG